jgi:hypothetical protein
MEFHVFQRVYEKVRVVLEKSDGENFSVLYLLYFYEFFIKCNYVNFYKKLNSSQLVSGGKLTEISSFIQKIK